MKVAVVGSRNFTDYNLVKETLDEIKDISLIVSGGARGADSLGERYAAEKGIPIKIFLPAWDVYGRSAGYRRNVQIVEAADIVIAFWDGLSRGTRHSINLAREKGKELLVVLD